jgi:DNA transformation protein
MSDDGLVEYLLDQLGDPEVSSRSMFGGHGIYRDGRMFALVYDGAVYAKVTEAEASTSTRPPFRPRPGQTMRTFRAVGADELEDRDALAGLAARAQEAAAAP